jgi:hypothetical protein
MWCLQDPLHPATPQSSSALNRSASNAAYSESSTVSATQSLAHSILTTPAALQTHLNTFLRLAVITHLSAINLFKLPWTATTPWCLQDPLHPATPQSSSALNGSASNAAYSESSTVSAAHSPCPSLPLRTALF